MKVEHIVVEKLVSPKKKEKEKKKVIITFDTVFCSLSRSIQRVDKREMVSAGVQMCTDNQ